MYIRKLKLKSIRSFSDFEWKLGSDEASAGWHVLVGDNGSGKSTLLRSCAVALMGPTEAWGLRENWQDWVRSGESGGQISLSLLQEKNFDKWSGQGRQSASEELSVKLLLDENMKQGIDTEQQGYGERTLWGFGSGWFSASFGPFRRFSGGDQEYEKLFYSKPKLARHLTLFGENVALTETLAWLKQLKFEELERKNTPDMFVNDFLEKLVQFINMPGFLPNGTKLESISSRGVVFLDANGCNISIESLSDGYRSILSFVLELVRQLVATYGPSIFSDTAETVEVPGVVLVDEIDVHMHPSWQRRIGEWLTKHFPQIQFIVTTHSPLVCQSAANGSITLLPQPGTEEEGERVKGERLQKLLYGDILDAYGTGVFGRYVNRSEEGRKLVERNAYLNVRKRMNMLSDEEAQELRNLDGAFLKAGEA